METRSASRRFHDDGNYLVIVTTVLTYLLTIAAGYAGISFFLYVSLVPGVIVAMVIPGFLFTRLLDVKNRRGAETLAMAVGGSVFLLMAAGLIINSLLPLAGIDDPLAPRYVIGFVAVLDLMLLLVCYLRHTDLSIKFHWPQTSMWFTFLYFVPPIFVIASIMGAISLNNGGTNLLTMAMLAGIGLYFLVVLLVKRKVPGAVYPYSLYWICLALLLSMSLRGWLISGHDILEEFSVFKLTHAHLLWSINYFHDSYNACLSITILPTMISGLMPKIPDQYIFRFVFQAIFAFMPVALYCFVRRYVNRAYTYLTAIFFISQIPLLRDFAFLTREEMAIFFFMLLLLVLADLSLKRRFVIAAVFGVAMIWSHYSTTYIALGVFVIAMIIKSSPVVSMRRRLARIRWPGAVLRMLRMIKIKKELTGLMKPPEVPQGRRKDNWLPGWRVVIFLGLLTVVWNTWITGTSSNLGTVLSSLGQTVSGVNGFWDFQKGAATQFNIFSKSKDQSQLINSYATTQIGGENTFTGSHYSPDQYLGYNPEIDSNVTLDEKVPDRMAQSIFYIGELSLKLAKVFIIAGAFWLISSKLAGSILDDDLKVIIEANLVFLILFILMPLVSANYGLLRAYQQFLIGLALPAVAGSVFILKTIFRRYVFYATVTFFIFYFLYVSSFIPQLIGKGYAQMQLNNFGTYYDIYYSHQAEDYSINWMGENIDLNKPVFSDWFAKKKIVAFEPKWITIVDNVLPENITRDSYVYADEINKEKGIAYVFYQGKELNYTFPTAFLNEQKDTIYDNGRTAVFK